MSEGGWSEWLQGRLSALGEELADEAIIEYIDSIVQLDESDDAEKTEGLEEFLAEVTEEDLGTLIPDILAKWSEQKASLDEAAVAAADQRLKDVAEEQAAKKKAEEEASASAKAAVAAAQPQLTEEEKRARRAVIERYEDRPDTDEEGGDGAAAAGGDGAAAGPDGIIIPKKVLSKKASGKHAHRSTYKKNKKWSRTTDGMLHASTPERLERGTSPSQQHNLETADKKARKAASAQDLAMSHVNNNRAGTRMKAESARAESKAQSGAKAARDKQDLANDKNKKAEAKAARQAKAGKKERRR